MRQTDTGPTENQHTIDLFVGFTPEELSGLGIIPEGVSCNNIGLGSYGSSATAPANAWPGGSSCNHSTSAHSMNLCFDASQLNFIWFMYKLYQKIMVGLCDSSLLKFQVFK